MKKIIIFIIGAALLVIVVAIILYRFKGASEKSHKKEVVRMISNEELSFFWELRHCFQGDNPDEIYVPKSVVYSRNTCDAQEEKIMSAAGDKIVPKEWLDKLSNFVDRSDGMVALWVDEKGAYFSPVIEKETTQKIVELIDFDLSKMADVWGLLQLPTGVIVFFSNQDDKKNIMAVLALYNWKHLRWFGRWPQDLILTEKSGTMIKELFIKERSIIASGVLRLEGEPSL